MSLPWIAKNATGFTARYSMSFAQVGSKEDILIPANLLPRLIGLSITTIDTAETVMP